MNKIIRNTSIICVAILAVIGIHFLMGLGQEEKPVTETKESESLESIIAEETLESTESVDSIKSPEINNSLGLEAKPTDVELEVREEILNSFNMNLTDIGFVVYDEEMDGFVLNLTNKDVIIEVAKAIDGDKTYWNKELRDPFIGISKHIQEQLGVGHPFLLKNPANDSYLLIAINGMIAYDLANGVDMSGEY